MAGRPSSPIPAAAYAMYAVAVAGLGAMLLSNTFVYVFVPLPKWFPGRTGVACAYGALLLAGGLALFVRKAIVRASAGLAALFLAWLVLLHLPRTIAAMKEEGLWAGSAQLVTLVVGAWLLFATHAPSAGDDASWLRGERGVRIARTAFAVALVPIGLHHFADLAGSAEAVPAWLPFRMFWGAFTGVAHVVAGLAILVGILPRLAAVLEAVMITGFVLLVHVTGVAGAPRDALQWSMLLDAAAIGGAGWIVARSYACRVLALRA